MDVTACILGVIIKPADKLGNTPGASEGSNYENHKTMTIFEHLFSMLKTGVCGEYGLNFCTWMNCLTCPLMSKAGIIKGVYEGTTTSVTKLVNLTPSYVNAIF